MPNPLVVDASPIIVLAKTGFLDLLRVVGDPVLVPQAVVREILHAPPNDPAVLALSQTIWLTIVDPAPDPLLAPFGLGPGEESVLAWALANPGTETLIDDMAGRVCAQALGIPFRGCLGLVIAARKQNVIPAARPVLERLRQVGLRLSDLIMNTALAMIGE